MKELGPINYYVNEKLNFPLPVSDDDITGTFTFLRAFRECNFKKNITAKDIGKTWLNNIIEDKTILWWGGKGHSAEDTAFQNLKQGIDAPDSGSIKTNGKVIAEQIGAQIFIDGVDGSIEKLPYSQPRYINRSTIRNKNQLAYLYSTYLALKAGASLDNSYFMVFCILQKGSFVIAIVKP